MDGHQDRGYERRLVGKDQYRTGSLSEAHLYLSSIKLGEGGKTPECLRVWNTVCLFSVEDGGLNIMMSKE